MPTLKHLLEELGFLGDPDKVKIPGYIYDLIVEDAEEFSLDDEE